jgi:hypothetical protein
MLKKLATVAGVTTIVGKRNIEIAMKQHPKVKTMQKCV